MYNSILIIRSARRTGQGKEIHSTMKKLIAILLALAVMLPCAALLAPAAAKGDSLYIIPDSDKRELTREDLWGYKYDTLLYAFNEIYARHGYKFETGSRCYNWFTQMPWYKPNASESSSNHHESYSQCSKLENRNVDLIKSVRQEMRDKGTTNPTGKGMPTPPAQVTKPRGFEYVKLQTGQKLPVYAAPSDQAYRANNGKAQVSTNGAVYALGLDQGWMLMLYEANGAGQYRVGYVDYSKIKGKKPALDTLSWDGSLVTVETAATLTDDPALTGKALATLPAGTTVRYLTTMYNTDAWDYIETTIDGKTARGFVPSGTLSITGEDMTEKDSPIEGNG